MKSYKIKPCKGLHEVWACSPDGETLLHSFGSFTEAAEFMRQVLPGVDGGGLAPLPKPSYVAQLREENAKLKNEIKRLKALLGEA